MGVIGLLLRSPRLVVLALSLACVLNISVYIFKYDGAEVATVKSPPLDKASPQKNDAEPDNRIPPSHDDSKPDDDVKHPREKETEYEAAVVDVYFALTNARGPRREQFNRFAKSLLERTRSRLRIHALVDAGGRDAVAASVPEGRLADGGPVVEIRFYDVDEVARRAEPLVRPLKEHFVGSDRSYYGSPIFFVPVFLHRLIDDEMIEKILVLDTDMEFRADIATLASLFDSFLPTHLMGLAREQQPVYRHVFNMYRNSHPGTLVGDPPPAGLTGFNSGVVLMHLKRMRASKFYNQAIQGKIVKEMAEQYVLKGHLGDQDIYTLLSLEHSEMFFVLPCTWNRQLCTWWGDHGYEDVMDAYHLCEGKVKLYHGNCNTPIPPERAE